MKETKVTWHKECFKHATSKLHIERAKARYEKDIHLIMGTGYSPIVRRSNSPKAR